MTIAKEKLLGFVDALIVEGETILTDTHQEMVSRFGHPRNGQTEFEDINPVKTMAFSKWNAGCVHLMTMLGSHGQSLGSSFAIKAQPTLGNTRTMLGILRAVRSAMADDLLLKVEDLVFAEAFADLLEQAEHLLANGYFLAAGVLGRAVLEEHMRKWCGRKGCMPAKPKPTLNDYVTNLYKQSHLNKIELKRIEAMIAVGNDSAHNSPTLKREDVVRLIKDASDFIAKYPIS